MAGVYIVSDHILSPLGDSTAGVFAQLAQGRSGIRMHNDSAITRQPFYASLLDAASHDRQTQEPYTFFEQLLIHSVEQATQETGVDLKDNGTGLILSSTKGNIGLLEHTGTSEALYKRIALQTSAKKVAQHFGMRTGPIVVSNACISGLLGILIGKRLIENGCYKNVIVTGTDIISRFIFSGFESFQAISPEACRPFDKNRKGLSLGEAAATVVLSSAKRKRTDIKVSAGASGNDANHISAPSRTGNELGNIIRKAIQDSGLSADDIGFVSAHGTATAYNDEMEAKAITVAGLQQVPVHSLKGYFGHTLGAAGLIESIISARSLQENKILPTIGFEAQDLPTPLNLNTTIIETELDHCVKTASGFGGCNAAIVFSKSSSD